MAFRNASHRVTSTCTYWLINNNARYKINRAFIARSAYKLYVHLHFALYNTISGARHHNYNIVKINRYGFFFTFFCLYLQRYFHHGKVCCTGARMRQSRVNYKTRWLLWKVYFTSWAISMAPSIQNLPYRCPLRSLRLVTINFDLKLFGFDYKKRKY